MSKHTNVVIPSTKSIFEPSKVFYPHGCNWAVYYVHSFAFFSIDEANDFRKNNPSFFSNYRFYLDCYNYNDDVYFTFIEVRFYKNFTRLVNVFDERSDDSCFYKVFAYNLGHSDPRALILLECDDEKVY